MRLGAGLPFKPGHRKDLDIFLDEKMLLAPLRWKKPRMIFVCSMTDLFAEFVPDEWIDKIFAVMALCPQHTFQVLTKRAERMRHYCISLNESEEHLERVCDAAVTITKSLCAAHIEDVTLPLPNVWLGVSAERQPEWDDRTRHLRETPAAIKFVSAEPLLGLIVGHPETMLDLDWVIVGGESGPHARPMHPDWARSLRDQCAVAGVPYFFKQHGEWLATVDDNGAISYGHHERHGWNVDGPREAWAYRVGKRQAGRLLDGREHNEFPEALTHA